MNNVNLNTKQVGGIYPGATINNGSFKVANQSPTTLTGALTVNGATNLNSTLTVNNVAATRLTGVLVVEKDGTFKQKVVLDNATLGSSSTTTGALVVSGGVGIGQNLYLGGLAQFNSTLSVTGASTLYDKLTVEAASDLNGQVTVSANMPGTDQDDYKLPPAGKKKKKREERTG